MAALLSVQDLAKSVPGGRLLFQNVALAMGKGEFVAVVGESGVGKSTFLNIVAGLDEPDAGSVEIGGAPLATLDDAARARLRRRQIGFVFQAFHILPHLTLAQNVALPLTLVGEAGAAALARAGGLLEAVGIGGRDSDYPRQLSGGELQRVAIARALANRPPLVLADEPTGNLDAETAGRILSLLIAQVREARTGLLLVTHSEVAAAAADRVLRLTRGGLVAA